MANSVPGKIIGIRIGGKWLACQTDATLNITVDVTEEDLCKPDGDVAPTSENAIPWKERTADSRDWNVDFNSKLMRDSLSTANAAVDVAGLIIAGNVYVDDFEFSTANGQTYSDYDFVYSGKGILTNFSLAAPESGAATQTSTITGNGPLGRTKVPVTT